MTKVRVDTGELMKFVKGRKMEESDLCMFLENMGVVLDRATWTHFKEVYAKSHMDKENGESIHVFWNANGFNLLQLNKPFSLDRPGSSGLRNDNDASNEADTDESDKAAHGKFWRYDFRYKHYMVNDLF